MTVNDSPWHIDPPVEEVTVRTIHKPGCVEAGETEPAALLRDADEDKVREIADLSPYLAACPVCLPETEPAGDHQ